MLSREQWVGTARVAGAVAITLAFFLLLLTAVAQQSVMSQLKQRNFTAGYSSAHALLKKVEQRQAQVPHLVEEKASLAARVSASEALLRQREQDYHDAWAEFLPLARRLAQTGACDLALGEVLDQLGARLALWREVHQCAADGRMPEPMRQQFQLLTQEKISLPVAHRRAAATGQDLGEAKAQLARAEAQLAEAVQLRPDESAAVESFNEMDVLRHGWMVGGGILITLPPPLLQILLSAFSGAFGALLITLVLIVYPKSHVGLTTAPAYGARMFLGALIAVCVYVILMGGTAVLGTSSGISDSGANYMTFCAVSILAGMFSDRVAFWLSDRADMFFQKNADAGAVPGGAP